MPDQSSSLWGPKLHISATFKQLDCERSLDHKCNSGIILNQFFGEPKTICIQCRTINQLKKVEKTHCICHPTVTTRIHFTLKIFNDHTIILHAQLMLLHIINHKQWLYIRFIHCKCHYITNYNSKSEFSLQYAILWNG